MTKEEWMQYDKKEKETFRSVRAILQKSGNPWAYNMCYKMPWKFYGMHNVDECVKILLDKYTFPAPSGGMKTDEENG